MIQGIGIVVLAILIGLSCGAMMRSNKAVRFRRSLLAVVIVSAVFGIGAGMVVRDTSAVMAAAERRAWPSTEGVVVKSEVRGTRAYHPYVEYEFDLDSGTYYGDSTLQVPGFGPKSSRREVARKSLAGYAIGEALTVRYNPDDPRESMLKIGASWDSFMRASFGFVLIVIAFSAGLLFRHENDAPVNDQPTEGS